MLKQTLRQLESVRIGELLVQKRLITTSELEAAIALQRETKVKIGEVLIAQGYVTPQKLKQVLFEQKVKRWSATALLALGATAGAAPQVMTQTADYRPIKTQNSVGGGNLSEVANRKNSAAQTSTQTKFEPEYMRVSLANHPNPTASDPLVGFCHPTAGKGYLSQGNNGITHRGRMAYAYDLATPIGTPIYAMRSGTVVGIRDKYPDTGGGRSRMAKFNYVWIEHDGGYRSAYLHLQQDFNSMVNLQQGDSVEAGQLIGYTGNSGWSTGPHLHLEVQQPKGSNLFASTSGFSKTVPFAVSGRCQSPAIASR